MKKESPIRRPVKNRDRSQNIAVLNKIFSKKGWTSALASALLGMVMISLTFFTWTELSTFEETINLSDVIFPVMLVPFSIVGWLIAINKPHNPLGWIYLTYPLIIGVGVSIDELAITRARTTTDFPIAILLMLGSWITFVGYWLFIGPGILLFPDGQAPNKRFGWALWVLAALMQVWVFILAFGTDSLCVAPFGEVPIPCQQSVQNPLSFFASHVQYSALDNYLDAWFLLTVGTSLSAVFVRYRESAGDVRQQVKWVAWMAAASLVVVIGIFLMQDVLGLIPSNWGDLAMFAPVAVGLPLTIGVAIFRYRLYDIDRLISRTLSYSLLTGALLAIYFGSVAVFQRFLPTDAPIATVISTLTIAALFNPLRIRIQRVIDSRFYRRRYDAEKLLDAFAAAVRDEIDLNSLTAEILKAIHNSMQPEKMSLWIFEDYVIDSGTDF